MTKTDIEGTFFEHTELKSENIEVEVKNTKLKNTKLKVDNAKLKGEINGCIQELKQQVAKLTVFIFCTKCNEAILRQWR